MIISSGLLADVSDLSLELMVDRYDNVLRDILTPVKSRTIVLRPNDPGITRTLAMRRRRGAGYSAGGAIAV